MKEKIGESLGKELLNSNIDLSIDYAEVFIDNLGDDELLKEIPIFKTLLAIKNAAFKIRDRYFVKKTAIFLKEFHQGRIKEGNMEKFKKKFSEDKKFREGTLELIMVTIDRLNETQKSEIFGRLFMNHIDNKITWDRLKSLTICLENIHPDSFAFLEKLSKQDWIVREQTYTNRNREEEGLVSSAGIGFTHGNYFEVNQLGRDLYEFGIKK